MVNAEKLEYLSINLQTIIMEIMNNQEIMKLLESNDPLPILPYSFNLKTTETTSCEIRVYYPRIDFKNGEVIQDIEIYFDIVCSKTLWTKDGDIRPLKLLKYLYDTFAKKSIFEVGVLHFKTARQITVNDYYDCIRVVASMMQT